MFACCHLTRERALLLRAQRAGQRARRVGTLRHAGVCFVPGVDEHPIAQVQRLDICLSNPFLEEVR